MKTETDDIEFEQHIRQQLVDENPQMRADEIEQIVQSVVDRTRTRRTYGDGEHFYHRTPAILRRAERHLSLRSMSWLGGGPSVPADFEWPKHDDQPYEFRAQICCKDLPTDIWGGIGPDAGWLVFFTAPHDYGDVKVFHITETGVEMSPPYSPVPKVPLTISSENSINQHHFQTRHKSKWQGEEAPLFMSGHTGSCYPYSLMENPACLLEIPTQWDLDWVFGDCSFLAFFISPFDLKEAKFCKAWGDVAN